MLEISYRNGTYTNPLVGPRLVSTASQTTEDLFPTPASEANLLHSNLKIMAVNNSSKSGPCNAKSPSGSTGSGSTNAGSASNNCTSPGPPAARGGANSAASSSSHVLNGAIQEDAISPQRPLSSASEESESSISEDDEISFNTIKRQVRPQPQPLTISCDEITSSSAVNNPTLKQSSSSCAVLSDDSVNVMQVNGSADADPDDEGNNNGNHHSDNEVDTEADAEPDSSSTLVLKKLNNSSKATEAMIESSSS